MTNSIFQEIDILHSEWERMDKSAKLGWLAIEKVRLNRLVNDYAQYIRMRGGFSNDDEKTYARKLLEMTQEIDAEGSKVVNDLVGDSFKELFKGLLK